MANQRKNQFRPSGIRFFSRPSSEILAVARQEVNVGSRSWWPPLGGRHWLVTPGGSLALCAASFIFQPDQFIVSGARSRVPDKLEICCSIWRNTPSKRTRRFDSCLQNNFGTFRSLPQFLRAFCECMIKWCQEHFQVTTKSCWIVPLLIVDQQNKSVVLFCAGESVCSRWWILMDFSCARIRTEILESVKVRIRLFDGQSWLPTTLVVFGVKEQHMPSSASTVKMSSFVWTTF